MPYSDSIKWLVHQSNPQYHSFNDKYQTQLASFHPKVFSKAYALTQPQQLLTKEFLEASMTRYDFEAMLNSWMENPATFTPKANNIYLISWSMETFSFLSAMLCRLHGLPNFTYFKVEWAPLAHHVLTTRESFNWAHIFSMVLKEAIGKYQNTLALRKPPLYLSAYVMS